ncbi:hypothetical protein [uncultured Roseovarius sp.]|uniref:hypothetical protein n=1 Tax=uncultured Roseovarius sp. TaxID=293344 RepID=UPI002591ED2A|nr:hypothetical protein [uncultured Roseovarius sp.]
MKSYEREVILALFRTNDWFDLYELHDQLRLSPAQIASSVKMMGECGFCETEGLKARMTLKGMKWVLKNRKRIFLHKNRTWASSKFVKETDRDVGEPYMPRLKSIDTKFFLNLG